MKKVLIVCEAGEGNGLGHFYRAVALAEMLANDYQVSVLSNNSGLPETNFNVLFTERFEAFNGFETADLVVLDGYVFSPEFISKLIARNIPFVEVSDFSEQLYPTNYWINTSVKSEFPGKGLEYALLRKEILQKAQIHVFREKKPDSIFIAFGGTDEGSNSLKTVQALNDMHFFSRIGLLYPNNGKDLELLKAYVLASTSANVEINIFNNLSADELIAITEPYAVVLVSSSTIACEMVALRKVVFSVCLYENQQLLHDQLATAKAVFPIAIRDINELPNRITEIDQESLFNAQKRLIDGFSEERIRNFISTCFQ